MAVGIRTDVARQLPSDGGLRVCQLYLPTDSRAHGPEIPRCTLGDDAGWVLAAVPDLPAGRLVLGQCFVVGSMSRRTLWASAALCCSPCLFCLARFRIGSLSRLCLLLFLPRAILELR